MEHNLEPGACAPETGSRRLPALRPHRDPISGIFKQRAHSSADSRRLNGQIHQAKFKALRSGESTEK